jgi:hypothetical protein
LKNTLKIVEKGEMNLQTQDINDPLSIKLNTALVDPLPEICRLGCNTVIGAQDLVS